MGYSNLFVENLNQTDLFKYLHTSEYLASLRNSALPEIFKSLREQTDFHKKVEILHVLWENRSEEVFDLLFVEAQVVYQAFNYRLEKEVEYLAELIEMLSRFRKNSIIPFLYRCLYYPKEIIQIAALDALGYLAEKRTIAHLQLLLNDGRSIAIRRHAADAIESIIGVRPNYSGKILDDWFNRSMRKEKMI